MNEFTLESLREGYLYFSNPTTFNDPFEFRPLLDTHRNVRTRREAIEASIRRIYPLAGFDERKRSASKVMTDQGFNRNLRERKHLPSAAIKGVQIFCMSANRESILLWAYYAESHSGICIGLEPNIDPVLKSCVGVTYSEEYPVFDPFTFDEDEVRRKILYCKSDQWKHEEEYRAVCGYEPSGYLKRYVDPSVFVSITFGANTSEEAQENVMKATQARLSHVTFERAVLADETFSIKFEPL